jgi:hypothetical protein
VFWDVRTSVMGALLDGSEPAPIMEGTLDYYGLVADGHNAYFGMEGSIIAWDEARAAATTLASVSGKVRGVAVDSTAVYWSEEGGAIRSVPIDGGEARTVATGTRPAPGLAIGRESVYWGTSEGLMAAPLGGGQPELVGSGAPWDVEVAGDDVVYVDQFDRTLKKVAVSGGSTVTIADAGTEGAPFWLALDGDTAYVTSGTSILKAPLGGGDFVTLASSPVPCSIAVDGTSVYWTDLDEGLKKVRK